MTQCPSTAELLWKGAHIAVVRCDQLERHPGPHRFAFEWDDAEGIEWPEAYDPDEGFDVEVDALEHDEVIAARIEQRPIGDDLAVERSHEAIADAERRRAESSLGELREAIDRAGPASVCAYPIGGPGEPPCRCELGRGHGGRHRCEHSSR